MLFNSFEFFLFLPLVFGLYWFVFQHKLRAQNLLILLASYFFYGWWSWKFMALLMLSTALDYAYGFWVASPDRKKAKVFLWLSIINNLGILGVFKYYNFYATQFQQGFELLGIHSNPILLNIALPIGISFYTFHGMSYVFDIYRSQQKPVRNFVDYNSAIDTIFHGGRVGESYNVGGLNEWTNLELVRFLCQLMDQKLNREKGTSEKLITFEQGLENSVDWYLNNQEWVQKVTSGAYQTYYEQMYSNR